jgi:hypothetical protein
MVRRLARPWEWSGWRPALASASRYLADTPSRLMPSSSTRSNSRSGPGANGEPSYSTTVAPEASAETSQFHIIQPVVVK